MLRMWSVISSALGSSDLGALRRYKSLMWRGHTARFAPSIASQLRRPNVELMTDHILRFDLRSWLLLATLGLHVHAASSSGSSHSAKQVHFEPEQIIAFASKVEKTLADRGARVAIIARMGRPLSELPEGMHFTHVAFAMYFETSTPDGRKLPGYTIYNLYQQDNHPDVSELVQDFPVDFFADVAQLEAGIIILSPHLQMRLQEVIASPVYKALHNPQYSVIANPFTLGRQNCTEFVLDVIHAAIYHTSDIQVIKANEKAFFVAQSVHVNPFKLLLGSLFSAEVSTSDQVGQPVTATFEKLGEYLLKYDAGSSVITVMPD